MLVTVAVHVTVLAPPSPAPLHWLTPVIGVVEVIVDPVGQSAEPVQLSVVTIVARPVGVAGVAALYAKLLVTVTAHVIVSPPADPTLLHWVIVDAAAAAPPPPTTDMTRAKASIGAPATARSRTGKRVGRRGMRDRSAFLAETSCGSGRQVRRSARSIPR